MLSALLAACLAILFLKSPYQPERPEQFRLVVKAAPLFLKVPSPFTPNHSSDAPVAMITVWLCAVGLAD